MATPLAMAVTELLQNAVEHAFPSGDDAEAATPTDRPPPDRQEVGVQFDSRGTELAVTVTDNGRGLPDGFSIDGTSSLGLSIVRDLVRGQLGGSIEMCNDDGTRAELRIPLRAPAV